MDNTKRPLEEEQIDEWELESVLKHRDGEFETEYLVQWTDRDKFSWIGRSNFIEGTDLLANYWDTFTKSSGDPAFYFAKYFLDMAPLYKKKALLAARGLAVTNDIAKSYEQLRKNPRYLSAESRALTQHFYRNVAEIQAAIKKLKSRKYVVTQPKLKRLKLVDDANLDGCSDEENQEQSSSISRIDSQNEVECTQNKFPKEPANKKSFLSDTQIPTLKELCEIKLSYSADGQGIVIEITEDDNSCARTGEQVGQSPEENDSDDVMNDSSDLVIDLDAPVAIGSSKDEKKKKPRANTCIHKGCGKSFKSKKAFLDHNRYHQTVTCPQEDCDWSGAPKNFNFHMRKSHSQIATLEFIREAREKIGLKPMH